VPVVAVARFNCFVRRHIASDPSRSEEELFEAQISFYSNVATFEAEAIFKLVFLGSDCFAKIPTNVHTRPPW
jgi:hypothetical protein